MTKERFGRIMEILGPIRIVADYILVGDLLKMVESGDAVVSEATWENHKKGECWKDYPPIFSKKSNDICTYVGLAEAWVMRDHCELWFYDFESKYGNKKTMRCKFHIVGDLFKINSIVSNVESKMYLKAEMIYREEAAKKQKLEIKELKEKLINNK